MDMLSRDDILKTEFSPEFIKHMQNSMEMGFHMKGPVRKTYPELAQAWKCIEDRLHKYLETHNTEWLVDIANFAMIEYMRPSFSNARFFPTPASESPGLANGISYNELMRETEE